MAPAACRICLHAISLKLPEKIYTLDKRQVHDFARGLPEVSILYEAWRILHPRLILHEPGAINVRGGLSQQ